MNLTVELSERGVRDGVVLVAAYHFLLAIAAFLGTLAIFVYAILPGLGGSSAGGVQGLFLPFLGAIAGMILALVYLTVGFGLMRLKNSARMVGIFLSLFGVVAGLFSVMGGIIGGFNRMPSDWLTVGMISLVLVCVYSILVFLDIITLIFLMNWQVRAVFYGEEWLAEAAESIEGSNR